MNKIRLKQHPLSRILDFWLRDMKVEGISEFLPLHDIDARKRGDLLPGDDRRLYLSELIIRSITQPRCSDTPPPGWLVGLCARPASLKVRHEVSGWKHAD